MDSLPLTLLDIILLVVMLISAILAMVRGFMREILSIASWAAAAILTIYAYPKLLPIAKQYVNHDFVAAGIVIAGVFLGTLLIVSVITIKISDMILDSRIGALDRTLGFLFGLGRGLIIMVVAFMFFTWLVPEKSQPKWVSQAKSWPVLDGTGRWVVSMSPDLEGLWQKYKPKKEPDSETPATPPAADPRPQGSDGVPPAKPGYDRNDRVGMQQLLDQAAPKTR